MTVTIRTDSDTPTPAELAFAAWLELRSLHLDSPDLQERVAYVVAETAFRDGYTAAIASPAVTALVKALEEIEARTNDPIADRVASKALAAARTHAEVQS